MYESVDSRMQAAAAAALARDDGSTASAPSTYTLSQAQRLPPASALPFPHPPCEAPQLQSQRVPNARHRLPYRPDGRRRIRPRKTADAAAARPTKYYFAYGSDLHIKQMKRRCPNSRYIGHARLANHRWQINERGYANVVAADGRWVDGLVYEIDEKDEAKLDINEGVAKSAYEKRYMPVLLHRAHGALYRRPVSWIVDKGGPAAVRRQAKAPERAPGPAQHWENGVLVYISFNHVQDSAPKEEYVSRINLGLRDARALGMADDYIRNCIRPFIPEAASLDGGTTANDTSSGRTRESRRRRRVASSEAALPGLVSVLQPGKAKSRPVLTNRLPFELWHARCVTPALQISGP
ncbi:hypothetical protein ACCO45_010225 [Purpureocillium lilacinum]|uniref:Uncharacterized protein n=1 Tax=Purpureocillium lilacinum TaxID=33203 RepID=A0ACC4DFQ5_PURLI